MCRGLLGDLLKKLFANLPTLENTFFFFGKIAISPNAFEHNLCPTFSSIVHLSRNLFTFIKTY